MKRKLLLLKYFLLLIIIGVNIGNANAQTIVSIKAAQLSEKLLKLYQDALKFSKQGKTKDALKNYDKLLKQEPRFLEAKLRKAGLAYDVNDFSGARKLFDEVIITDSQYDADMYYAAGLCSKNLKDYAATSKYFSQYLENKKNVDEAFAKKVKREISESDFRVNAYKTPKPFIIKPVEGFVNTSDLEYLPSITIDGKQMVFTRRISGQEDLYVSNKNADAWGIAQPLETINTNDNEAAHTMSADGNLIVFTQCNNKTTGYGSCDLYQSRFEEGKWSLPSNLGMNVNSAAWDSQPTLGDNGKTIIFSSDRKGSIGSHDLWIIKKGKNNKWLPAINLGPKINTPANEESPFLHADGKTLYFRSNGHIGMGLSDLYYTKYNDKTNEWSAPINMGYPINTEGDEGSLFVDAKGNTAYFASDKDSRVKGKGNLDIYYFDLPIELRPEPISYIKVSIIDASTNKPTKAKYNIIDLTTNDTISAGIAEDGTLLTSISKNKNYALNIDKSKYYFHSENFNTQEDYDVTKPYEIVVKLKPIETIPDAPIVLHNIFFETGSSLLLASSQAEIDNLAAFLNTNQNLKIKIVGHTDNVGSDIDNQKLSEARAKSVQDALAKKGISASRLNYEGKGESMPIADNNTAEGRRVNRRTEFLVVK